LNLLPPSATIKHIRVKTGREVRYEKKLDRCVPWIHRYHGCGLER
jgi:hypothetical protein